MVVEQEKRTKTTPSGQSSGLHIPLASRSIISLENFDTKDI